MNTALFLLLMRMGEAEAAEAIRLLVTKQTIYVPGDSTRNTPGSVDSQVFVPGDTKRKVVR